MSKQIDKLSDELESLRDENFKLKTSQSIFPNNQNKDWFVDTDFLNKTTPIIR